MVQIAGAMPANAKSPSLIAADVKLNLCPQFHVMFAMLFSAAYYFVISFVILLAVFNVCIIEYCL